jgi:predicted 2-oxoglutarate/Fe(II)-dependent dioxygenase YbiX/peroxiredoxin
MHFMNTHPERFWRRGKQVPYFQAPTNANPKFSFGTIAGRCTVLMFYGSIDIQKNREALQLVFTELRPLFDDKQAMFFGVCVDPNDPKCGVVDSIPGIRFFWDYDLKVSGLYGATTPNQRTLAEGPLEFYSFTLVLESRLRVWDCIPIDSAELHTKKLKESIQSLLKEESAAKEIINAPVLIVPNVFPKDFCRKLISLYETNGGAVSGTMTVKDGKTVGKIDRSFKRRLDYDISDSGVIQEFRVYLIENLFPQIRKALHFNPTHIERYIVACYDGSDNGFFRPHRDNTTPGTAHRRFACTINLNAEDYTGGDLRFPEYSTKTYRAPTGGAVIFSGSILHEALPVTSGQRYATLPFIHDDAAEVIRKQNLQNISDEIIRVGDATH